MASVVLENLTKVFAGPGGEPVRAVVGANLAVTDRELMVLVGPSGCGKTTLLRLIAGLEEPTGGSISVDGRVVNRLRPAERDVAMVFQHHALFPHLSAYDNIAFGLRVRKVPPAERERRVRRAAETLDLTECLERKPAALSGGERQRVAVARALVRQPRLFLLDEPLSQLDAPLRLQMRAEMARLHQRLGATMIYVTHDQVEAMALGDRIAVMNAGVLQQVAEPMTLYRQPANLFVAGFIGSPPMNLFRGRILQRAGRIGFVAPPGPGRPATSGLGLELKAEDTRPLAAWADREVILGLRPEYVRFDTGAGSRAADGSLEAAVTRVEWAGSEMHCFLESGAGAFAIRCSGDAPVHVNQRVLVWLNMREARFFDPTTGLAIGAEHSDPAR